MSKLAWRNCRSIRVDSRRKNSSGWSSQNSTGGARSWNNRGSGGRIEMRTPHQILGPFFPLGLRPDTQGDLTIVEGVEEHALGEIIEVTGRVLDDKGKPVPRAT